MDALLMNLTTTQEWLCITSSYKKPTPRPSLLANDIDGAFNYVIHRTLINIPTHFRIPSQLVKTIDSFHNNQQIALVFDGEEEPLVPFQAGLP